KLLKVFRDRSVIHTRQRRKNRLHLTPTDRILTNRSEQLMTDFSIRNQQSDSDAVTYVSRSANKFISAETLLGLISTCRLRRSDRWRYFLVQHRKFTY